jgi:hypothetical protein
MSDNGLEEVKQQISFRQFNLEETIGIEKAIISALGLSACIKAGRLSGWSSNYSYIRSINGKASIKVVIGMTDDAVIKSFAFASKDYWIGDESDSLLLTDRIPFDEDDVKNLVIWLLEKI